MQVIHKLKMDLLRQNNTQIIDAVQLDSNTRKLELSLYEGAMPWNVPEGVSVAVAYSGPGGNGIYDTLPDGSAACTVAGNVVTATLIPQAIAMHGNVQLAMVFTDDNGKQLSTFCVTFRVAASPAVGAVKPADYINLRQWVAAEVAELMAEMQRTYIMLYANDDGGYSTRWQAADIQAAYQSGRELCCVVPVNGQQVMLPLLSAQEDGTRLICTFGGSAAWLSGDEACTVSAQLDVADEAVAVMVLVSQGGGGSSGVYVGTEEPTDPNVNVWIDPEGDDTPLEINPVKATEDMTQPVGVTPDGELVTAPGGGSGGGEVCDLLMDVTITERVSSITQSIDNVAYKKIFAVAEGVYGHADNSADQRELHLKLTNAKGVSASIFSAINVSTGTTQKSAKVQADLTDKIVMGSGQSNNGRVNQVGLANSRQGTYFYEWNTNVLQEVGFVCSFNTMEAGARFRIWGVRV